jgi:hypothetical protein
MTHHEGYSLGRGLLRRQDEIALVFSIGIVDDNDHLAAGKPLDGIYDVTVRHCPFFLVWPRQFADEVPS